MKKLTFVLVFCMIANYSYCQQNYKPGYILNNNNDTLHVELQEEILVK
ncbi:hypothetical protein [Ferruginibacter sp.]|nr:hypothetical protein [Ferruginibacter sp.]MBC7627055.1 hypothetical protein [Ferruginibacter sp.]